MKNEIVNALTQATQSLKDTVAQAVGEIKGRINEKLGILATVKQDLATSYDELTEINEIMTDFASEMTDMCEETDTEIVELEDLLYVLDPDHFDEEFDEEDEDTVDEEDFEEEDTDTNESDFGVGEPDPETEETED